MIDEEKILSIIHKIDSLHIEDPTISLWWNKLAQVLSENTKETINFLDSCNDENVVNNISAVFDDISANLQSQEFIKCLDRLENKFPNLLLHPMIEVAIDVIFD
ncbi:hypothetical protein [Chamaesiphon sp. VAR_48_metabat_403]|uniref:hypothetical protein n=1 Tax=Chamaesiphon sp. VAR_48_metabat_403 TaxID=2964700 RepID=UPI00286E1B5B|nr:hypothetical protein [Chamaesiphon sp. VAR_48_metabat_403]